MIRDIGLKTDHPAALKFNLVSDLLHLWNQEVNEGNGKAFFRQAKGARPPYAASASSYEGNLARPTSLRRAH
jgi:hypothetical protein